jgi:hypothetical protein
MIFVEHRGEVIERRLRHYHTFEVEVKGNKTQIPGIDVLSREVPDGVYELAMGPRTNDVITWIVGKRRMGKRPIDYYPDKLLADPTMSFMVSGRKPEAVYVVHNWYPMVTGLVQLRDYEGFHPHDVSGKGQAKTYAYFQDWCLRDGSVHNRRFYFGVDMSSSNSSNSSIGTVTKMAYFSSAQFVALSETKALVRGGMGDVRFVPAKLPLKGSALVSIRSDGLVGMVAEAGKLYTLPGGKAEPGESAFDCLMRELNEELPAGWVSMNAYGPFQSELCTYFVTGRVIPGIEYKTEFHPDIHPWVKRVIEDARKTAKLRISANQVKFIEKVLFRLDNNTKNTLRAFLTSGPRTITQIVAVYGDGWKSLLTGEMVVFGNLVWLTPKLSTRQALERSMENRVMIPIARDLLNMLPASQTELLKQLPLKKEELQKLIRSLPLKMVKEKWTLC